MKSALERERVTCVYITLTRLNAKSLIWPELKEIDRTFKLGGTFNEAELTATVPNGSIIRLYGANNEREIEKLRGLGIYLCIIDECQSFRSYFQRLIDEIISKALFDYGGTLALTGTPGPVPSGYFYDVCQGQYAHAYSHFSWTMFENPWLERKSGQTPQALLQRDLDRKGVTLDDPTIQRECFGKWVVDTNALVFKYEASKNHFETLPPSEFKWNYVFGVDIGFEDADAIAVIGWNPKFKDAYLVEEVITTKQGITELAHQIESLIVRYRPDRIVMDTGGLGKKVAEEIQKRFALPITAAEKVRKFEFIEILNDALRTKSFYARKSSRFAEDSTRVEWDRDSAILKIKDTYHSDICVSGDTKITTQRGEVEIKEIKKGDFALTRDGFKRVLAWAQTSKSAPIIELTFSNGSTLCCTKTHPIFTKERGFIPADALLYTDTCLAHQEERSVKTKERLFGIVGDLFTDTQDLNTHPTGIITGDILTTKRLPYIAINGFRLDTIFQVVSTFIIKTATSLITNLKTLCAWKGKSIKSGIDRKKRQLILKNGRKELLKLWKQQKYGIGAKKEEHGIESKLSTGKKRIEFRLQSSAVNAAKITLRIPLSQERFYIAPELVALKQGENRVRMTSSTLASSVKSYLKPLDLDRKLTAVVLAQPARDMGKAPVYNITIADKHEYFANGILTSNCDATLYGFREALHWLYEAPPPVIEKGTPEWVRKEEEQMEEAATQNMLNKDVEDPFRAFKEEW